VIFVIDVKQLNKNYDLDLALLNIEDNMRQSYLDYAMPVNIWRARLVDLCGLLSFRQGSAFRCTSIG